MRPIDADELKKDLGEVLMALMKSHEMSRIEKVGFALDVVDEAETLDVAPVVYARWIWNAHKQFYECSRCAGARYHDLMLGLNAQYCGYCGAKMIGDGK